MKINPVVVVVVLQLTCQGVLVFNDVMFILITILDKFFVNCLPFFKTFTVPFIASQ